MSPWTILTFRIQNEVDVVLVRQRARQIGELLRLDPVGQTRVATAVSEIARNAFRYAGGGRVEFLVSSTQPPLFQIRVSDQGPGISELPSRLESSRAIGSGHSAGLSVARRLVDHFEVESSPGGTTVLLGVALPAALGRFTREDLARVAEELARRPAESLLEELHQQNQELAGVLDGLMRRQEELGRLNQELEETNRGVLALYSQVTQELEDTNRGVMALYSELDEQAEQLRLAGRVQRQFFSYMSHEFRTPLHSSVALSNLLLESVDPPLPREQRRHVGLIRKSMSDLLDLVGDLLDLARIDAGKLEVHPETFAVADLLSALRGMFRPLVPGSQVTLTVEEEGDIPPMHTDQRKLAQILRNLLSNALKFTERGEVRLAAALGPGGAEVHFTVTDTGPGLSRQEQERIFEDFVQAGDPFQRGAVGSGLGLPLSRRLAELLGGRVWVESEEGIGSTFSVVVPREHPGTA